MSNGDWIKHAAIGLIVIAVGCVWAAFYVGSEIGKARGESNKHTAEYERHAENKIRATCLSGQGGDIAECVSKVIQATNEDKRAQSDLVAQTEMARWAFYMLIATIGVAVITGAGVYYVWQTLKVTRDMGRSQAMAYVDVSAVVFYWGSKALHLPEFKIKIRNSGATPAKWFQIRQDFLIYDLDQASRFPKKFSDLPQLGEFSGKWSGIPSGETGMRTAGPDILDDEVREFLKCRYIEKTLYEEAIGNTHGVAVFGEIRYCTVFDEVYTSQFVFGTYRLKEPVIADTKVIDEIEMPDGNTRRHKISTETPQSLSGLPVTLDLYKPEKA